MSAYLGRLNTESLKQSERDRRDSGWVVILKEFNVHV